jgi:hypothetical protein
MAIQDPGFSLLSSVTFPKNRLEILNATSSYASMPPQCHLKSLFRATSQVSQGPCNIYSKLSSSIRQMCQAYGSVLGVANVVPSSQVHPTLQGPCNIYSKLSSSIRQMCQAYGSVLGVANVVPSSQVHPTLPPSLPGN